MDWITNNISITLGLVVLFIATIYGIIAFVKLPKAQKIADVKEWLKFAVTEAEKSWEQRQGS